MHLTLFRSSSMRHDVNRISLTHLLSLSRSCMHRWASSERSMCSRAIRAYVIIDRAGIKKNGVILCFSVYKGGQNRSILCVA